MRRPCFAWWPHAWAALACNDELVEVVPRDVCYSETRWIGGKRGSEEMYPGEDCVGCHLENDGPELALGGTVYPYVIRENDVLRAAQSGEHCFGVEGITVTIEDADGLRLDLVTNRAGNFFVEGSPRDLAKPYTVRIEGFQRTADGAPVESVARMPIAVNYGGCARCHDPNARPFDPSVDSTDPRAPNFRTPVTFVGLPGYYEPENYGSMTVEDELRALAAERGVE